MSPAQKIADVLSQQGKIIGAKLGEAIDALGNASFEAGPGMSNRDDGELFAKLIETIEDSCKVYSPAARALIIAEAKIEFFGLHAPKTDRTKWANEAAEAYREVATPEAA